MLKQLPNILTLGRLVLTVIFLAMLLFAPEPADPDRSLYLDLAFVLFVITGLTDIVDGKLARKFNVTSKFGRILDPLADKVLVCGTFLCFAIIVQPKLFNFSGATLAAIHWTTFAILVARELYVTILRQVAEARGVNFAATRSGKLKMFLQSFAIGTVIIKMAHVPTATWGSWFTAITYILMLMATIFSGLRATLRPAWKTLSTTATPQNTHSANCDLSER